MFHGAVGAARLSFWTSQRLNIFFCGTVPYWNLVHALSWKDSVQELTVDELDGATHRGIMGDERLFALLKRYCKVIDPRANAMLMTRQTYSEAGGIGGLAASFDDTSIRSSDAEAGEGAS